MHTHHCCGINSSESGPNLQMDILRKTQICWAEVSFTKAAASPAAELQLTPV